MSPPPPGNALAAPLPQRSCAGTALGARWHLTFAAPAWRSNASAYAAVASALEAVAGQMSQWRPESELSRFNRAAPGTWQVLSPEFFHVLAYACELACRTDGAFDPTLGALSERWGYGATAPPDRQPDPEELRQLRATCGWQRLQLDRSRRAVRQPGGLQLDLSAVAKGFAVDHAAAALLRAGFGDFLLELGGELRARGTRPDREPWNVAIERPALAPDDDARPSDLVVPLRDFAIATSGDYRRVHGEGAARRSHTLDPQRGVPLDNGLCSVSVVHRECMQADAWCTALSVMGSDAALDCAGRAGLAVLLMRRHGGTLGFAATPAFEALLA